MARNADDQQVVAPISELTRLIAELGAFPCQLCERTVDSALELNLFLRHGNKALARTWSRVASNHAADPEGAAAVRFEISGGIETRRREEEPEHFLSGAFDGLQKRYEIYQRRRVGPRTWLSREADTKERFSATPFCH